METTQSDMWGAQRFSAPGNEAGSRLAGCSSGNSAKQARRRGPGTRGWGQHELGTFPQQDQPEVDGLQGPVHERLGLLVGAVAQ